MFLLSFSLSIDAFGIGAAYGVRKIKIPFLSKFIICIVSIIIMSVSIGLGKFIATILPLTVAKLIGSAILIVMGVWVCFNSLKIMKTPELGDLDNSKIIDSKEAIYLGAALSLDSLVAGFGGAVSGLHSLFIPFVAALFQVIFLTSGIFFAQKISAFTKLPNSIWTIISGIMLIIIALMRLLF